VVRLESGTAYEVRLRSPALDGEKIVRAETRGDAFSEATGRALHVCPRAGRDSNDGLTRERALKSLRRALALARAGDTVLLAGGRYLEGDLVAERSGKEHAPIVVRDLPGEAPVLDGTDPGFRPRWEVFDRMAGVYRTPCATEPVNAYLNGGQFFHYLSLDDLRKNRWDQPGGYAVDGKHLYARFPGGGPPDGQTVTIPRFTTGLTIDHKAHIQIIGVEFCYFGFGTYHRGIHLNRAAHILVDRCSFHHTGVGVTLKRDADFNTIQNCSFTESPVSTWSWQAVKEGGVGYESGGVKVYTSDSPNQGNVIRYNVFRDLFDASGLYSASLKGPTTNMDFHSNLIDRCSDDGIETDGAGINNRIYDNTIRDFLTGISVAPCAIGPTYIYRNLLTDWKSVGKYEGYPFKFNVSSRLPTRWVFLYHNTCTTSVPGQDGFLFKQYSKWSDVISRNNVYAGTGYALQSWSKENPVDFDYDVIFTTSDRDFVRWVRKRYGSLEAFARDTGQEEHGLQGDPGLSDPKGGDYSLSGRSPCIDRGVVIPGFNDAFAGKAPDVGAFEFPSGMPTIPPGPRAP